MLCVGVPNDSGVRNSCFFVVESVPQQVESTSIDNLMTWAPVHATHQLHTGLNQELGQVEEADDSTARRLTVIVVPANMTEEWQSFYRSVETRINETQNSRVEYVLVPAAIMDAEEEVRPSSSTIRIITKKTGYRDNVINCE